MSVADGESRRMACPRGVSSHQSCSTFTLMTSQSTMARVTSYLCVTAQYSSFTEVETTIGDALEELTHYYRSNSLRANPDKTQVTAFHLRNKEANRSLKVEWNRTKLENTPHPKYLGVTLDRTLSYKEHMHNTKMKVASRNNLLRKLSNSKWGANASTIRTTALALCYSVAEYAAPVWARSSHAQKLNPELNSACRAVTGCLKPTNVEDLYLLAGIAPPDIRRDVCARVEKTKQETNEAHSLYGQNPAERRLESRNCFLRSVNPADFPPKVIRQRWRYYEGDTTCECGLATENTAHMMQCTLLEQPCSLDDLNKFNDTAKKCVERWNTSLMTRRRRLGDAVLFIFIVIPSYYIKMYFM